MYILVTLLLILLALLLGIGIGDHMSTSNLDPKIRNLHKELEEELKTIEELDQQLDAAQNACLILVRYIFENKANNVPQLLILVFFCIAK